MTENEKALIKKVRLETFAYIYDSLRDVECDLEAKIKFGKVLQKLFIELYRKKDVND